MARHHSQEPDNEPIGQAYKETSPLIGYYFAQGKLRTLDGMAPIPEVGRQIDELLAA